ncbi:protease inhibitor I42 family protein [Streptomyces sp. ISL-98]|uniref:protease inhibitor I42 family protein n=1 Tax=Streptomyces sp. ISL-98 TaxID=2819192 RepID=UPI001BE7984D|nr:protease inhibitor I42 family protein [Streptomyces sp. ISL-98]MBT2507408.1 protease inhibitor I42 family protein [Streptomyces sp. ISL-98]
MTGSEKAMRIRLAPVSALPLALLSAFVLTGCGLFGPATYETDERSIEVDAGDEFTLSLPASPSMGQDWYLVSPHPDADVVERTGQHKETEAGEPDLEGGGSGERFFDFKAVKPGTTEIKLIHCPYSSSCSTTKDNPEPAPTSSGSTPVPTATGKPGTNPEYFIYTVTVR